MKKDQVLDYIDSLTQEDKDLESYVNLYEALSNFLTDFEFLKDLKGKTQKDIADAMGTTQSAISRIASLKTNPSYKQLLKMTEAVDGKLFLTPMGDMTVQVPYDLQDTVKELAEKEKESTTDYLNQILREKIAYCDNLNQTVVADKKKFFAIPHNFAQFNNSESYKVSCSWFSSKSLYKNYEKIDTTSPLLDTEGARVA